MEEVFQGRSFAAVPVRQGLTAAFTPKRECEREKLFCVVQNINTAPGMTYESVCFNRSHHPSWAHQELRRKPFVLSRKPEKESSNDACHEERRFMVLLKDCAKKKDMYGTARLHGDILQKGLLERSPYLASSLVSTYAKGGMLAKAVEILENLPTQNVVTWNALIAGYIQNDQNHEALTCLVRMQNMGISPNAVTFICLLKACAKTGSLDQGKHIHDKILSRRLLEQDVVLGTALIDMYAKCGELSKAHMILEEFPFRNTITWSALIAGYVQHGHGYKALNAFKKMQNEGLPPDVVSFISILKACGSTRSLGKVSEIHGVIVIDSTFLKNNVVLGTALVDAYVKCDALVTARRVFDELLVRNALSWSALMSGYVEQGQNQEALKCFERMLMEGISPDEVSFISILKACGNVVSIDKGKQIHKRILQTGLMETNIVLGTALVDMYAKFGLLSEAEQVFEQLPARDVVTWCALIAGYTDQRRAYDALNCLEQMQIEGLTPDQVTFICILKACSNIRATDMGKKIHNQIVNRNLLVKDTVLSNALMDMYVKCGELEKAQKILEEMPHRNVISWSTLIAGYADEGQLDRALKCFKKMQYEGLIPNAVTFICILKACGNVGDMANGIQIHDDILCSGLLEKDIILGNALVDMYARCGMCAKADEVLKKLPARDVVSWNTLIAANTQQGYGHKALDYFQQMQSEGLSPNAVTFTCILKACGIAGIIDKGEQIHAEIVNRGLLGKDYVLGTVLVDMYAKCGFLEKAYGVFEELTDGHIISLSALIANHAKHGRGFEALNLFEWMQSEGLSPDSISFTCILSACGKMGAIDKGKQVHNEIINKGLLEKDIIVGTALVDMYAKFGMLAKAQEVLTELPARNVVSWSALMSGYAQQGQAHAAFDCFKQMESEHISPDSVTLLCLLRACIHSRILDKTEMLFTNMTRKFGIMLQVEHCTRLVMGFVNNGHFEKAISVIKVMPLSNCFVVWLALLVASRKWGNVDVGKLAFVQAVQLDKFCAATYAIISDIFIAVGLGKDVEDIEAIKLKYSRLPHLQDADRIVYSYGSMR